MIWSDLTARVWLPAMLAFVFAASPLSAQYPPSARPSYPPNRYTPAVQPRSQPAPRRPYRVAENPVASRPVNPPQLGPTQANEHPLMPALRWAYDGIGNIEKLQDYSATMVKRERVNGKVGDYEYMFIKIRHNPFSVYVYFLAPAGVKGREVIFIRGKNNGNMWADGTGIQKTFGTVSLPPTGMFARRGQRYPLTEIGILNLVSRLIEIASQDVKYGECEVKFFKGAKINDRLCTCIQVIHPVPRRNFLFHLARIFVDDELNIPIRYEAYDWPQKPGDPPELIEQYTYLNLKLNNGFTDADFDTRNPNYQFR